jgi:hypothetical protein
VMQSYSGGTSAIAGSTSFSKEAPRTARPTFRTSTGT